MSNIASYRFLIQSMLGSTGSSWRTGSTLPGMFQFSQLNSSSIQSQLKAAGINTSSKQYKAVIQQMAKNGCTGSMFTSVQSIKNLMKQYNSEGEWIDPDTGLSGLLVSDENRNSWKKIIDIPQSSRNEMFELAKKSFLQGNGMSDGSGRGKVYTNLVTKMKKDDRLAATWTMEQYEHQYNVTFVAAAKAADPTWTYGKAIPSGALDGITRESIENSLVKRGNTFAVKSIDYRV